MNLGARKALTRTAATALVAVLALSGCSGDEEPSKDGKNAKKASESPSAVDPSRVSPKLPKVPEIKNGEGAKQDVELGKCATGQGEQSVSGSVKSSAKQPTDYLIRVNWINATYDVRGMGFTVVRDLAPGKEQKFTIDAKVASGAEQCVVNVMRGNVPG